MEKTRTLLYLPRSATVLDVDLSADVLVAFYAPGNDDDGNDDLFIRVSVAFQWATNDVGYKL